MLLTLRVTGSHAADLEILLDKSRDKLHSTRLPFGHAHLFFPEVSADAVTVALVVDVDAIAWSSNESFVRVATPNAPKLSVAIARMLTTALAARAAHRPDLVIAMLPIEARVSSFVVPTGSDDLRALFAPLGYDVGVTEHPPTSPSSSVEGHVHQSVRLVKQCPLFEVLSHVYMLGPVLERNANDPVLEAEREALLLHAEGAARGHPLSDRVLQAYATRRTSETAGALARLLAADGLEGKTEPRPAMISTLLDEGRMDAIVYELREVAAHSVVDLGCGDGKLLARLVREKNLTRIVGFDVSSRLLEAAATRMKLDRRGPKKSERLDLFHGSLFYADARLQGFDAAVLVDVLQYVETERLRDLENAVFRHAHPKTVVVMMNGVGREGSTEADVSAEAWTLSQFDAWVAGVSERCEYRVRLLSIGSAQLPARMAVFSR